MVQRQSYNGFAESISKSICDLSSHDEYMKRAHQMVITGILMSGTLMFLTSQTLPTHSPLLQPHMDVQHLPAEVKLCVKRERTFLNLSRLSMWIAQCEYDANRQDQ